MRITNQNLIDSILKALSDEKSRKILALIAFQSLSVIDIIKKADIPSSSAYRKISELEEKGLVGIDRTVITPDGKTFNLYKASFLEISLVFRAGDIIIEAEPNRDIIEKAFNLFFSIRR